MFTITSLKTNRLLILYHSPYVFKITIIMDREIDAIFAKMKGMPEPAVSNIRPFTDEVIGKLTGTENAYCVTFVFNSVEYRTHFSNVDLTFRYDGESKYKVEMNLRKCFLLDNDTGEPMETAQVSFAVDLRGFKQVLYGVMCGVVPMFHAMLVSMTGLHVNLRSFIEFAWRQYEGMNMIIVENQISTNNKISCMELMGTLPFRSLRNKIKAKIDAAVKRTQEPDNQAFIQAQGPTRNLSARIAIRKERKNRAKTSDVTQLLEGLTI